MQRYTKQKLHRVKQRASPHIEDLSSLRADESAGFTAECTSSSRTTNSDESSTEDLATTSERLLLSTERRAIIASVALLAWDATTLLLTFFVVSRLICFHYPQNLPKPLIDRFYLIYPIRSQALRRGFVAAFSFKEGLSSTFSGIVKPCIGEPCFLCRRSVSSPIPNLYSSYQRVKQLLATR